MVRELIHDPFLLARKSTPATAADLDAARDLLKSALKHLDFGKHEIIVRINSLDTPY